MPVLSKTRILTFPAALQAQIPNDTEDGFGDFGNYDV